MKLTLVNPEKLVPDARLCAQVVSRAIEVLVIEHLREKNGTTAPNRWGLQKTNYYAEAANNVEAHTDGTTAVVAIDHPGIALHYEGGTVRPKKKALAIPIDPTVAGIWPSEAGGEMSVIWKKGNRTGFLKDDQTGDLLYLLIPSATLKADTTVLPTDGEILGAAENAIREVFAA